VARAPRGDLARPRRTDPGHRGEIRRSGLIHVEATAEKKDGRAGSIGARTARARRGRRLRDPPRENRKDEGAKKQDSGEPSCVHAWVSAGARPSFRGILENVAFDTEVDDILRELLRAPGTLAARLGAAGGPSEEAGEQRLPLGAGAELVVAVADGAAPELAQTLSQAARELRACIRRYGLESVPEVRLVGRVPRSRAALIRRTESLLEAFAAMHGAVGAVLMRGPELLAVGGTVDAERKERLSFLRKRIDAAAARQRGKSSHGEVVGDDVFARSFWFDAYLIVFFDSSNGDNGAKSWSVDFVRHRARAVARELAVVLPHLDDDPPAPANVRPLPTPPRS